MFPNPQDALPLPPRPSIERYRKLAKGLVKASKSADEKAIRNWVEQWTRTIAKLAERESGREATIYIRSVTSEIERFARHKLIGAGPSCKKSALSDAQFILARSHGFASWPKFSKHLEALTKRNSPNSRFEEAADAIVNGDVRNLERLLGEDPRLVQSRSVREHRATLLHYVSANGVEGYRQRTPKNIVEITELLLDAGAEVDATADVYGGGCTALGLAATSVYPERAGVQQALLQALLNRGASVEQLSTAGHGQSIVRACLANGRVKAAEFLAGRGARLDFIGAAGIGRLDLIMDSFAEGSSIKPAVPRKQIEEGFACACLYGQRGIVEFLLGKGMDLAAHDGDGQTPLHWAVIGGRLDLVHLLLRQKPPLEAKNRYGGTVLGQALWSAAHGGDPDTYIAILEALAGAGAKIPERHIPVNSQVDQWLARRGSQAEPSWHWYGEG